MTPAQRRLIDVIRSYGTAAQYWDVANDWVKDSGPAQSLAFTNIQRSMNALIKAGLVVLDDDGYLSLTDAVQ